MTHKIQCKYAEFVMAPSNALSGGLGEEYETIDGVKCLAKPYSSWNNSSGDYDSTFNDLCIKYFSCPFSTIKSIWIARLGFVDSFWHLVKMEKV